jgi:hypothetical protein
MARQTEADLQTAAVERIAHFGTGWGTATTGTQTVVTIIAARIAIASAFVAG